MNALPYGFIGCNCNLFTKSIFLKMDESVKASYLSNEIDKGFMNHDLINYIVTNEILFVQRHFLNAKDCHIVHA